MPLIFYTMLALVQEFLPHMLKQGDGAILTAQGGSTVQGLPDMSGPSPAQAAQRNYLQALHAEVAEKGVYVGMLYIGAASRTVPSTPRWRRPKPRAPRSGRCLPSTRTSRRLALDHAQHEGTAGSHLSVVSRAVDPFHEGLAAVYPRSASSFPD
jgi:NAD(P)-dependent dehydrogenase (short-subunit alcohol dehydrogenase family)